MATNQPQQINIYSIFFDGASKGNPGKAGSAAVLYKDGVEMGTISKYIGPRKTNNEAEYMGLILGLILCVQNNIKEVHVYGDSQLIIRQMIGQYQVKNKRMKELWLDAQSLLANFSAVHFEHIERSLNGRADQLANEAIALVAERRIAV
jgi:ribonuclease HI